MLKKASQRIGETPEEWKILPQKCIKSRDTPATLFRMPFMLRSLTLAALLCSAMPSFAADDGFVSIFNGKDLTGWTPKITGFELGDNHQDTFRVEEGKLVVRYDKYKSFDGKFGHLFFKEKYSHYQLRFEYRFVGEQCPGGPGWALRNSGAMLHCQEPKTMTKDQLFPVSIEGQLLGGSGKGERATGNMCSPGTNIVLDGKLYTTHCMNSKSRTFHGDVWVTAMFEVNGGGKIKHFINEEQVMEYEQPQLDPKDKDAAPLVKAREGKLLLEEGYISLQAESHPVEFRKIEIKQLKK
jgi:hypothetical protein